MTKVYSYCSTSSYSNINGKEEFESCEFENNDGKKRMKKTSTKDGITTTIYSNDKLINSAKETKKLCKAKKN